MRIILYITLLLLSTPLFAQNVELQDGHSANVESPRANILPCSSAQEALGDKSEAMRYAIPVAGWQQEPSSDGVAFSSSFYSPFSWIGRQSFLSIAWASAPYTVYVGGLEVGRNMSPSSPAQFNVTRFAKSEADSPISIKLHRDPGAKGLDGWSTSDQLELGDVVMLSQPTMYVRDVDVLVSRLSGVLNASISIRVKSELLNPRTSRINYELESPDGKIVHRGFSDMQLDMRGEDEIFFSLIVPDSLAWSAKNPKLYRLNVSTQYRGRYVEYLSFNIGLRSLEMSAGELMVNGEREQLKAIEVESAIGRSQIEKLKAAGYNTLKVRAGVFSDVVYQIADSLGLYLIATAPINSSKSGDNIFIGGNPSNDPERLSEYVERCESIYSATKLHASVIAYDLADESLNGINLYESYLYLKGRQNDRPIIYLDGQGQWNSDRLDIQLD